MPGTITGGAKAAAKNKATNPNFYRDIGALGGAASNTGGFYNNPELARKAGAVGGAKSRRKPGVKVSPEGRAQMSIAQRKRRKREAEQREFHGAMIADSGEFAEGFNAPTGKDKLYRRFK